MATCHRQEVMCVFPTIWPFSAARCWAWDHPTCLEIYVFWELVHELLPADIASGMTPRWCPPNAARRPLWSTGWVISAAARHPRPVLATGSFRLRGTSASPFSQDPGRWHVLSPAAVDPLPVGVSMGPNGQIGPVSASFLSCPTPWEGAHPDHPAPIHAATMWRPAVFLVGPPSADLHPGSRCSFIASDRQDHLPGRLRIALQPMDLKKGLAYTRCPIWATWS